VEESFDSVDEILQSGHGGSLRVRMFRLRGCW
jgi:hypothetical protein